MFYPLSDVKMPECKSETKHRRFQSEDVCQFCDRYVLVSLQSLGRIYS